LIPYLAVNLSGIGSTNISNILHIVFTIIDPIYAFVGTFGRISQVSITTKLLNCFTNDEKEPAYSSYFEFETYFIGLSILIGILNIFIYSGLLYFLDSLNNGKNLLNSIPGLTNPVNVLRKNADIIEDEDDDVKDERERVINTSNPVDPLVLSELRKIFIPKTSFANINLSFKKKAGTIKKKVKRPAVRNLVLGFKYGEVFGLLGPNGAGKTTTINIISAQIKPDAGFVKVKDQLLEIDDNFFNNVGLCPQHNPFWDELTLREHLVLYASIKGVAEDKIGEKCDEIMDLFDIKKHADKQSKFLSGGTKRKLSFAISIFNAPDVALLDGKI
jgi:ATP-binding cassette, subfamily A (ABC1), member 5